MSLVTDLLTDGKKLRLFAQITTVQLLNITIGRTMLSCFIHVTWFSSCVEHVSLMFHCLIRIFETTFNISCGSFTLILIWS